VKTGVSVVLGNEILVEEIGFDVTRPQATGGLLRLGPSCSSYGAAAILVAATGGANHKLCGVRSHRIVATMNSFAKAAGVRRRRRGSQHQRGEIPHQCQRQKQSGDQALHVFCKSEPYGQASIEQACERAQALRVSQSGYFIGT